MSASPAVGSSTHEIHLGHTLVEKRYRSWRRDEPTREWTALRLLHEHAPGLAAEPVRAALETTPPTVVMRRLPGASLVRAVDGQQLDAMVRAIARLHSAVPANALQRLPERVWPAAELLASLRDWVAQSPPTGPDRTVRAAVAAASAWVTRPALDRLVAEAGTPVLGRADGNLANHLWDGVEVRLVDFEDSGRSELKYELADVVEHLTTIAGGVDAADLIDRLALSAAVATRLHEHRRLFATFWLLMLLPGGPFAARNPPETLAHQAERVLALLG